MKGLRKVNADLVGFVQSRSPQTEATLDMDATLVETRKHEALPSYKKYRAYQPLITYWSEAELIVHSEFRDGNVPAGHQQLRVLVEALEHLSTRVEKVMLRSDTAGYQRELLRYCAEGRDERFGVIEFAVGVRRDGGVPPCGVRGCRARLADAVPQGWGASCGHGPAVD